MSSPAQPPQQPGGNPYAQSPPPQQPGGGNPFAQGQQHPQAPGPYGQQLGQQPGQFPQQGGQFGGGLPQPQARRGNVGLGLAAGLVTALVGAVVYAVILGKADFQVGWIAVGIGFLSGLVAGKVGGRSPALAVGTAIFSLVAVYVGQILGIAIAFSSAENANLFVLLTEGFTELNQAWKEFLEPLDFLFFILAAVGAFSGAKKAAA